MRPGASLRTPRRGPHTVSWAPLSAAQLNGFHGELYEESSQIDNDMSSLTARMTGVEVTTGRQAEVAAV
eukprot:7101919-Alexandrium_andersonii.AAC.1